MVEEESENVWQKGHTKEETIPYLAELILNQRYLEINGKLNEIQK